MVIGKTNNVEAKLDKVVTHLNRAMFGGGPKTTGEMLDEVCSTTLDRIVAAVADASSLMSFMSAASIPIWR